MGKVPTRVKFDEDGLPIPQTSQVDTIQFDEDGLPIPVKKKPLVRIYQWLAAKLRQVVGKLGVPKPNTED